MYVLECVSRYAFDMIVFNFVFQELDELKSYPVEVLHGFLYIGNWRQGNAAYVQKDLKLKAHVCVCLEAETL